MTTRLIATTLMVTGPLLAMTSGGTVRANPPTVVPTVTAIPTSIEQGCMSVPADKELTLGTVPTVANVLDPKTSIQSPLPNLTDTSTSHYGFRQFYGSGRCPHMFVMDLKMTPQTSLPTEWSPGHPIAAAQQRFNPNFVLGGIKGIAAGSPRGYREIDPKVDFAGLGGAPHNNGSDVDMCRKMFVKVIFGWKKNGWTSFKSIETLVFAFAASGGFCEPVSGVLNQQWTSSYGLAGAAADGWGKVPTSGVDTYRIAVGAGLLQEATNVPMAGPPGVQQTGGFSRAMLDPFDKASNPNPIYIYQELPVGVAVQGT